MTNTRPLPTIREGEPLPPELQQETQRQRIEAIHYHYQTIPHTLVIAGISLK